MSVKTPTAYFPNVSIRIMLSDLFHDIDGPVTDGATVTFTVTDLAGNEQSSGVGSASDDDWSLIVQTPETPGPYKVVAQVTVDATTGTFVHRFDVKRV